MKDRIRPFSVWSSILFGSALILAASWTAGGQQRPSFRAKVDVVDVSCIVRDRRGRYLEDLTRHDFQVYEDGVRQELLFFHREKARTARSLSVALVMDSSASVKDKLAFEQKAAIEFFGETLTREGEAGAVVQFDSDVRLLHDFSTDPSKLAEAIMEVRAEGATRLYDAIWVTVRDLLRHQAGRRVLVVLSDGADTRSSVSWQRAIRTAQSHDVVIYGVGVKSSGFDADFEKLKRFARATGGRFVNSKANLKRLRQAFNGIRRDLGNQYSLGYVSSNSKADGSFRKIRVALARSGLKVRHREGYYAAEPSP